MEARGGGEALSFRHVYEHPQGSQVYAATGIPENKIPVNPMNRAGGRQGHISAAVVMTIIFSSPGGLAKEGCHRTKMRWQNGFFRRMVCIIPIPHRCRQPLTAAMRWWIFKLFIQPKINL